MERKEPKLGDYVSDRVTSFSGIVIARSEYLSGEVQLGIQSRTLVKDQPIEVKWFAANLVDVLTPSVVSRA